MTDAQSDQDASTHFGFSTSAAAGEAAPRRRGVSQRRGALRSDERSDVGGPAPALEGQLRAAGHRSQRAASAISTSPAALATSASASPRPAARETQVTLLDINADMLAVGRARARKEGPCRASSTFVEANAEFLPFPDNEFDAYTIAFGIRNVPRIDLALDEAFRVLRRGGRFLCLEFSQVDSPRSTSSTRPIRSAPFRRSAAWSTGDGEAYRYLVESIRRFPSAEDFRAMIEKAGFDRAAFTKLSGGIVAIHSGWKL